jgi:tetratricopeptide (TPR) repeat protein
VSIDRDAALKEAEQLLRQGKLDGAIEAYVRLVEDRPSDWSSINTLGDLCLRAGDVERAIAQFTHVADQFFSDGSLQKAAALYKKALRAQDDHEPALQQLGEIAVRQGLAADAELHLHRLAEQRERRGDDQGAAESLARLSDLKGAHARSRSAAPDSAVEAPAVTAPEPTDAEPTAAEPTAAPPGGAPSQTSAGETAEVDTAEIDTAETDTGEIDTAEIDAVEASSAEIDTAEAGAPEADADEAGSAVDADDVEATETDTDETRVAEADTTEAGTTQADTAQAGTVDTDTAVLHTAALDPAEVQETEAREAEDSVFEKSAFETSALDAFSAGMGASTIQFVGAGGEAADAGGAATAESEGLAHEDFRVQVDPSDEVAVPLDGDGSEWEVPLEVELGDALDDVMLPPDDAAGASVEPAPEREPSPVDSAEDRGEEVLADTVTTGAVAVDVDALELASRNPVTQFSAAAALGRHYVGCGDLRAGTRWLERAVAATPERPEDGFAVKHELAGALEHLGESAQALAVLIDLDLDSGGYQDGRARIDKLMAAQVRGADA